MFYLPLAILGCPPEVFLGQFAILKIYQFWIHTQGIDRIPMMEGIFSTPSSHRVHHAKNPVYIDRNYGGTLVIWDRMFGSWQPELATETCHYGTTNAPNTLSPLKLNLRHWMNLFSDTIRTKRVADKIGLWFMPTGWRPADCIGENYHLQKEGTENRPKYDPSTTRVKRIYAGFSTLMTFVTGVMFIFLSPQLGLEMKLGGAVLIVIGLVVVGDLLENKSRLVAVEAIRLPLMLAFIYSLWSFPVTTSVVNTVTINKSPDVTLAYAADVIHWPSWHPSSLSIDIDSSGPLLAGQGFNEEIMTPIGKNQLVWTGLNYEPAREWSATADNLSNGSLIKLTYIVSEGANNQTIFERRLEYTLPNFALVVLNPLYLKAKIEAKSMQSMDNLKDAVEAL